MHERALTIQVQQCDSFYVPQYHLVAECVGKKIDEQCHMILKNFEEHEIPPPPPPIVRL